jgi:hypothetical protein
VVNYCINYGKPSTIPPRMLSIPSTVVGYEERIRAFWVAELLDSTSTLGVAWNFHVPHPEINGCIPCDEDVWTMPEGLINMFPFGNTDTPSAFSLYVRLVSNELWHVHNFLQQSCDMTLPEVRAQRQAACQEVDGRLLRWQLEFDSVAAASSPPVVSVIGNRDAGLQIPNVILTYCTLDCAVIVLYQRMILIPGSAEHAAEIWYHASARCMQSCNHMVSVLRSLADEHLDCINPQLIPCVFVAARFYIMHAKAFHGDIPAKLDLLAYVLKACGQRWPLARRLGKALTVASMAQDTVVSKTSFPDQFFDLQYSWPDIDDALRKWAQDM